MCLFVLPLKHKNCQLEVCQTQRQFFSEFLSDAYLKLPDPFLATGKGSQPKINGKTIDSSSAVRRLFPQCERAPVGKGDQTVIDTSVRSCYQMKEGQATVEWKDLEDVLKQIKQKLVPGMRLEAKFHKLLIYSMNDYFWYHCDSKKGENHILTLAVDSSTVDCLGGEVRFRTSTMPRSGHDIYKDEKNCPEWKSKGAGDWCCWFATTPHRVVSIDRGYRVIATYNIMAYPEPSPLVSSSTSEVYLERLPREILSLIVDRMDTPSLLEFSRTSKSIHEKFGSNGYLLARSVRPYLPTLVAGLKLRNETSIGFLLQHRYSLDGREELDPAVLRGRDAYLAECFKILFPGRPMSLRECRLVEEYSINNKSPIEYMIATGVRTPNTFDYADFYGEDDDTDNSEEEVEVPSHLLPLVGQNTLRRKELRTLNRTFFDFDGLVPIDKVPFRGVFWTSSGPYLSEYCRPRREQAENGKPVEKEGALCHLWGNESTFDIYWYRDIVLIVKVLDDSEVDLKKMTWSQGVYAREHWSSYPQWPQ